jgi:hypothetical protein
MDSMTARSTKSKHGSRACGSFAGIEFTWRRKDGSVRRRYKREAEGHANRYSGVLERLQNLFERPVDLIVESAIRNPYFSEAVDRNKALLYAA